jgi:acetate kinase
VQVACFDTTFHQTMPAEAYTYALPAELCRRHGIRRYGAQAGR